MASSRFSIGIVAPAGPVDPAVVAPVQGIAAALYGDRVEIRFHPHCFLSCGHFAGDDAARTAAVIEYANAEDIDAVWFGRGGYGSARVAEAILDGLGPRAFAKPYLGYSDIGSLLAGLYRRGAPNVAHGPMPHDFRRSGGAAAVERGLRWLVDRSPESLEPGLTPGRRTAAFNLTVLCHLIGTPLEPDLSAHELLVEEVSEHMYRIDRNFCHLASTPLGRSLAGLRLGRCTEVIPNDPDFVLSAEEIARFWCERAGIPYLGEADIAHDSGNKVVPFGSVPG